MEKTEGQCLIFKLDYTWESLRRVEVINNLVEQEIVLKLGQREVEETESNLKEKIQSKCDELVGRGEWNHLDEILWSSKFCNKRKTQIYSIEKRWLEKKQLVKLDHRLNESTVDERFKTE